MSEKIYVRKCERYTIWEASKPIEVDIEKLRKCDPPYTGESNEDLVSYLIENVYCNDEFHSNETNIEVYGEEEVYVLSMEDEWDMEVYSDSRNKFGDDWIDVGTPNEEYRKTGLFKIDASSNEETW